MIKGQYRNEIDSTLSIIESEVGDALDTLDDAECFAVMETEDMEPWQIEKVKVAVIEAIKILKPLKEKLW